MLIYKLQLSNIMIFICIIIVHANPSPIDIKGKFLNPTKNISLIKL